MTKKQKQAKYEKLLKSFDEGHRKLKHIKQEMVILRKEIDSMPTIVEVRPDELLMKHETN